MKYLVGTGYHPFPGSEWFYEIWKANTLKYADPDKIVVLASAGAARPKFTSQVVEWIAMNGDLGHVQDLIKAKKNYAFSGWSITLITTALLAYFNECHFYYKEQDCLAFGNWVGKIHAEAGRRNVMVGGPTQMMPASNSLLWVRHEYIPEFIRLYLSSGDERNAANIGEQKFARLLVQCPEDFGTFSFGYDRDRPLHFKDKVFYAQKLTKLELRELAARGLLELPEQPPEVKLFSGRP